MPESKGRPKRTSQVPKDPGKDTPPKPSPRWWVPLMLTCFLLGLLWIVVYYLAPTAPIFVELGQWNMAVGFGLIMTGFALSTRWR
jgi:hypothetical protein